MGPSRETLMYQRQYLIGVFISYQTLVEESLRGGYDSSLDTSHHPRLEMLLRNHNENFEHHLCSRNPGVERSSFEAAWRSGLSCVPFPL